MFNNNKVVLKKTALAVFTALYVGATGQAVAEVGVKKVSGTTFYEPTFTTEDLKKVSDAHRDFSKGELFKGQSGRTNRHLNQATAEQIFQPSDDAKGVQSYIVQLKDEPVATYRGTIKGLTATAAPKNNSFMAKGRVNMKSQATHDYQNYLKERQTSFVSNVKRAGVSLDISKRFTVVNNAMVVEMTQADAILMSQQPGVKRITKSRIFKLRSDRGAEFIGADKIWDGSVSPNNLTAKGEGMVVGIIDTGINTDHVAFQVTDAHDYAATNPFGAGNFVGDCEVEGWENLCNDKLIGVRSYEEITVANDHPASNYWRDNRPHNGEDYNGHGSHTASTAAGNYIENTPLQTFDGQAVSDGIDVPFNFPSTSGVAPNAHIISYQVCWPGMGGADAYAGCPESAILSAFEDAISDGVDTINFSIGGAEAFPWEDPMELAFLSAREAGISVAAAAGNSGPAFWSADHASPWVTTVGASSHDRVLVAGVKEINSFESDGNSWTIPSGPISGLSYSGSITGEVVLAANYPDPDPYDAFGPEMCNVPFPADTFTADQIVLCVRGDIPRVDKAVNVQAGGGGGLILQNTWEANNMVADNFVIPGIQVDSSADWQLRNWINNATPGMARATITDSSNTYEFDEAKGNILAEFSSMGPSNTNNTLVPDVTAPGVAIYAANADEQPFTNYPAASDWTMMSGTSMASPHVAGALTLLTQIHPEWTPAEIQSALAMTAKTVMWEHPWEGPQDLPYNFMAGSGAIDVASAAKAGLVMDETYENYVNANPNNGGLASWLNTPSMVEMDCERTCSWMRTVTATQDGTWNTAGIGKEDGVEITVSPASFTLKAGQSQSIIVQAKLPEITEFKVDPQEPGAPWQAVMNNYWMFNGTVILTEANGNAPEAHLPIVAANVIDQLPTSMEVDFTRDKASETFRVNTDDYSQLTPRYYGLVKPTETEVVEKTIIGNSLNPFNFDKGWDIHSIDIPEGTKSVVFYANSTGPTAPDGDLMKRHSNIFPFIHVGVDKDGSGTFIPTQEEMDENWYALEESYYGEITCQSFSMAEENFCILSNPTPGKYWFAIVANGYKWDEKIQMNGGYAIISEDSDANNITVTGPESHNGNGDYNLTLNWDLPGAKEGDVYYGGFDLGNMPGEEGTLGFTALKFKRGEDAITWSVSQDKARSMDQIEVNVKINANMETYDRDYDLNLMIPEGLTLVEGTLTSSSKAVADAIVVDGNKLTLTGSQEATRNVKREYIASTNLTSEQCHTPLIDEFSTGGYIDLHGEFGIQPNGEWMTGDAWSDPNYVPLEWLFWEDDAKFELYNQANAGYVKMHTTGVLQFNDIWWMMNYHRGPGFLYEAMAPLWNGNFSMDYQRHWEDDQRGLTIANQFASERPDLGTLLFLEYDNVTDTATGDEYDFEVILRNGIDFHEGMPEIVYAYDNLPVGVKNGAIFVEGWAGAFSSNAGAKDGELYTMLGYDNLDEVLSDDLVICLDYDGPERSEVELNFIAVVNPEATGSEQNISFTYDLAGENSVTVEHAIAVSGNIKVAALADMTVAEDTSIDGIEVLHVDANKVSNVLEVTGDNITAEIDGMSFNLTPAANFTGDTQVTVTVRDNEHSSDATSTSFMLTVTPVNDASEVTVAQSSISIEEGTSVTLEANATDVDGDELTYTWQGEGNIADTTAATTTVSGLGVGTYNFTVSVTDGLSTAFDYVEVIVTKAQPESATPDAAEDKSGGSFGWLLLFALPILARSRNKPN